MQAKLVYLSDSELIENIKFQVKKRFTSSTIDQYFQNLKTLNQNGQPIFLIGNRSNNNYEKEPIHILYSLAVQYKFVLNLARCIHLDEIFISQQTTLQQINEFENDFKDKLAEFKSIILENLVSNQIRIQTVHGFSQYEGLVMSLAKSSDNPETEDSSLEKLNQIHPEIIFKYFQLQDSQKRFFELQNQIFYAPQAKIQDIARYIQIMQRSYTAHIPMIGIDKNLNEAVIFGNLMIVETIFGKKGKLVNIVVDQRLRGKGYGKAINKLLLNQGWKRECKSISLTCQQIVVDFYEKVNFKVQKKFRYITSITTEQLGLTHN